MACIPWMASVCPTSAVHELSGKCRLTIEHIQEISLYILGPHFYFSAKFFPMQKASKWPIHSYFHIDDDKQCRVSVGKSFLCEIKYSTCEIFSVHRVSSQRTQLSAWMLSHTRTTSGQSLRASISVDAASSWFSSRDKRVRGTNSNPADAICIPSSSNEARAFLRSVMSQIN